MAYSCFGTIEMDPRMMVCTTITEDHPLGKLQTIECVQEPSRTVGKLFTVKDDIMTDVECFCGDEFLLCYHYYSWYTIR